MKTIRVTFTDVGRRKLTWSADLPDPLTQSSLEREVKTRRALLSNDIDFDENGGIYVGGLRRVGSWSVNP